MDHGAIYDAFVASITIQHIQHTASNSYVHMHACVCDTMPKKSMFEEDLGVCHAGDQYPHAPLVLLCDAFTESA